MSRRLFIIALSAFLVFSCENSRLPLFQSETSSGVNFSVTPTSGVNYSFTYNFNLTLTPITDGDIVYYAKTDGTTPVDPSNNTVVWLKYEAPILIDSSKTIQAYSISKDSSTTVSSEAVLICEKRDTSLFRYVDLGSGLDTNGGSLEAPYKTIQKGIDAVPSGGTVCVKAGVYNEALTITKGSFNLIGGFLDNWVLSPSLDAAQAGYTSVKAPSSTDSPLLPKDSKATLFVSGTASQSFSIRNLAFLAPNNTGSQKKGSYTAALIQSSALSVNNCSFIGHASSMSRGVVILDSSPQFNYCFISGGDSSDVDSSDESTGVYISSSGILTAPIFNTCKIDAKYSVQASNGVLIKGASLPIGTVKPVFNSCTIFGGMSSNLINGVALYENASADFNSCTVIAISGNPGMLGTVFGINSIRSLIGLNGTTVRTINPNLEATASSYPNKTVGIAFDVSGFNTPFLLGTDGTISRIFASTAMGTGSNSIGVLAVGTAGSSGSVDITNISVLSGKAEISIGIQIKTPQIKVKNCDYIISGSGLTSTGLEFSPSASAGTPNLLIENIKTISAGLGVENAATGIKIVNTFAGSCKVFINRVGIWGGSGNSVGKAIGLLIEDSLSPTFTTDIRNSIIHGGTSGASASGPYSGAGIAIDSFKGMTLNIYNNTIFSGTHLNSDGIELIPGIDMNASIKNNIILAKRYAVRENSFFNAVGKLQYNAIASKENPDKPLYDSINGAIPVDDSTSFAANSTGNFANTITYHYENLLAYIGLTPLAVESTLMPTGFNGLKPVIASAVYSNLYKAGIDLSVAANVDNAGGLLLKDFTGASRTGDGNFGFSIGAIESDIAP